jgi:pilus assembly protein CpaE
VIRVLIIGDNALVNAQVQAAATRCGFECRHTDIAPLDVAAERAGSARRDFTILHMSADNGRALSVLGEIRNTVQGPIIAVGPANDPKYILRVLREGADEYVDEADIETELEPTFTQYKVRRMPDSHDGRLIGILSPSGGGGASTLAANLAVALAQRTERTALCDLRLISGDQTLFLDLSPSHTIADLCRNSARMDQSMLAQCLAVHSSGVHLLAAPHDHVDARSVWPQVVRQVLAMARTLFPFVVLDLDRSFAAEQLAAIVQTDLLLLTFRLDMASLQNARRVLNRLDEIGIEEDRIRLVVSQHRQPKELPTGKAEQALGMRVFHCVPYDPASVNSSINKGTPVVIDRPRSKAAKSFCALAERLCQDRAPGREFARNETSVTIKAAQLL